MTNSIINLGFMDSLVLGVDLRNSGNLIDAERYLLNAALQNGEEWQPYFELGILFAERGDMPMAKKLYRKSLSKKNEDKEIISRLLAIAIAERNIVDFNDILETANVRDESGCRLVSAYKQLMQYVNLYTKENAEIINNKLIDKSRGWLFLADFVEELKTSLAKGLPYAFIRLGDGEGTWLHQSIQDEANFHTLYSRNRDEFWEIWYGQEKLCYRNDFYAEMNLLSSRLGEADLIGIPPIEWVRHEFSIGSIRGIPGTLNTIRMLENKITSRNALCTQLLHFELSDSEEFLDLLRSLDQIYVISCHPEMIDILRLKLGIHNINYIPVPGEPSRRELLGETSVTGEHFPTAYRDTISKIRDISWQAKICLVGAGILGKRYCLEVRNQGGIAIDLGSIMDKWNNKKTRPDF